MSSYKQALEADSSYVHLEESASMPIFVTTKNLLYHKIEIKMGTKVIVKFRIKPRRANAPATGKSKSSTENLLITMRVTYGALRMEFSTGYNIDTGKWDAMEGRSIGKDESDEKINDGLMQMVSHVHNTVDYFRVKEIEPTQNQFKETFQKFRDGTFLPPRQQRF